MKVARTKETGRRMDFSWEGKKSLLGRVAQPGMEDFINVNKCLTYWICTQGLALDACPWMGKNHQSSEQWQRQCNSCGSNSSPVKKNSTWLGFSVPVVVQSSPFSILLMMNSMQNGSTESFPYLKSLNATMLFKIYAKWQKIWSVSFSMTSGGCSHATHWQRDGEVARAKQQNMLIMRGTWFTLLAICIFLPYFFRSVPQVKVI